METVTIDAHNSDHSVVTDYTGLVRLTTSTGNGNWSIVTGAGTLNNSGNGIATYLYDAADNGTVVLALSNAANETLNVDATNGSASEDVGEDPDFDFTIPIYTAETYRDEFNVVGYAGNDGSRNWTGNWIEAGEANGPSSGFLQVRSSTNCTGGNCMRLGYGDSENNNKWLYREADISDASFATFTYDFDTRSETID